MIRNQVNSRYLWGSALLLVTLGLSLPGPAGGQEAALTLEETVAIAMERNPLVRSARELYQASRARIRQARAFPQPSLDIDSDLQPGLTDFSDYGERYIGISQTIPFPGKTYLQGRVASEEADQILADAEMVGLDVRFQVTEAFYGLLRAEEQVGYARQNLQFTEDFVQMTELKFQAGDVPQMELIRARVEAATAANQARLAENEERLAKAALNFLLGRIPSSPLAVEGELRIPVLPYDLEEITAWALQDRPEIQKLMSSIEQERLIKKQGFMSYLPDFDVGASKHKVPGEEDTWDVTLSLALPVFFWQPVRGEIAEADANLRSLQEEAAHLSNGIALEVEGAFVNLTSAANQIRLFEEDILTQAEQAYEMYQFAYQQGEIDAIDLIESRRTLNEVRTSYVDALFNYDVARAAIERSIGRPLQEQRNDSDRNDLAGSDTRIPDLSPGELQGRFRGGNRFRGPGGRR